MDSVDEVICHSTVITGICIFECSVGPRSDLGLHRLLRSPLEDARHKLVNSSIMLVYKLSGLNVTLRCQVI